MKLKTPLALFTLALFTPVISSQKIDLFNYTFTSDQIKKMYHIDTKNMKIGDSVPFYADSSNIHRPFSQVIHKDYTPYVYMTVMETVEIKKIGPDSYKVYQTRGW